MESPSADLDLIRRCIDDGDNVAWEAFVRKFSRLIWVSVLRTFSASSFPFTQQDLEDLYSSVFLSLIEGDFRKLRQYRGENACSVATWLSVITVRMAIDFMRKERRSSLVDRGSDACPDILEAIPDRGRPVTDVLEDEQMREVVRAAAASLSPGDRVIYGLLFERGLTPEEAAREARMSVNLLYTRKSRIVSRLKRAVADLQEKRRGHV